MKRITRREALRLGALSLLTPYVLTACATGNGEDELPPPPQPLPPEPEPEVNWFEIDPGLPSQGVFGLSVASGDPSPQGVILWTRINPEAWQAETKLAFEMAATPDFAKPLLQGLVEPAEFSSERDYTVKIDLDGRLEPGKLYYYRFIYNKTASRTGKARTLPAPSASLERLKLGVLTCQDYTNGYYATFAHLAQEELDFVVHLGDIIYETVGDPTFQSLPFPDRRLTLPSGQLVVQGLEDYRYLYRSYRSDPFFQAALEAHTWIIIWDDHETANDCYYDYDQDCTGLPDHPYFGDAAASNQLKLASQRAWSEYIPARPPYDPGASRPLDALTIYRSFQFGDLAELFMTDERTYRVPPPCGVDQVFGRYASLGCPEQNAPTTSMLGPEQRDWLLEGMKRSRATWKIWGNEVLQMPLKITALYFTLDGWDGYQYERELIARELQKAGVKNLVVLTGDLHSALAGYIQTDYSQDDEKSRVGVEFMTPAVTSANLVEQISGILRTADTKSLSPEQKREVQELERLLQDPDGALQMAVSALNPHMQFFNSSKWGYSVMEFDRSEATYTCYSVDKSRDDADASKAILKILRVPQGRVSLEG